ncbi:MAG: hypothetical protein Q4A00_00390 [Flavobacteriaceae bacterium]|nr:hypothetical protein [Flavobacteriaceae bacterium]
MKKIVFSLLALLSFGYVAAQKGKYQNKKEEIKHRFAYLAMNGEFKIDPNDKQTVNDPRNPSRLVLFTSEEKGTNTTMEFYHHSDEKKLLAKCAYQYIGSRPDPHYFPAASKTSIWDIFEKVEDIEGDCSKFKYVISRSPHDVPPHMHLRYGDDVEALLNMSKDHKDDNFNPWWPEYKGTGK